MDLFKEDIVQSRSSFLTQLLYVICWALFAVCAVNAFMMLQMVLYSFSLMTLLLFLLQVGLAVALFFGKDLLKIEYDYTFTNGVLDFARVYRQVRRKELGSMRVKNVTACGHVADSHFQTYLSMRDCERKNWFLNRDGNLFYFYYNKENKKHLIIIEPSEEMVEMIKKVLPAGVYQG